MKLDGSVVAVTGAASGIGRQLALQLASRHAILALADLSRKGLDETAALVAKAGGRATTRVVDVTVRPDVEHWAQTVVESEGHVDVLVNNAGVTLPWRPVEDVPYEDLRRIVDINLWGPVHGTLAFLPHLRRGSTSAIVTVASLASLVGASGQVGYCTSKFGVRGFMESLRIELAGTGVHVMVVMPGGVRDTAILRHSLGATSAEITSARRLENLPMTPTAASAAKRIVKGIERERSRVLIGVDAAVMSRLTRFLPVGYARIVGPLTSYYQRRLGAKT